jgi:hypothetical protein
MGKHYAAHLVHGPWTSGGMKVRSTTDGVHLEGLWVLLIMAIDLKMDG